MADRETWPPLPPLGGRQACVETIAAACADGHCLSLVGMSNVGKSFVLRALCREPLPAASETARVYIDCNLMVEFTDQGFYELILRCLRAGVGSELAQSPLASRLEQRYKDVVQTGNPFLAHLGFTEALSEVAQGLGRRLVLVLDGFDEVMGAGIDRALLNLRALRDSYPGQLAYVTATRRRLTALRRGHGSDEFSELFGHSTHFLGPLSPDAAAALVGHLAVCNGLPIEPRDVPLILEESGGHPALLTGVCYALGRLRQEARSIQRPLAVIQIREQLDTDVACQAECDKLWQDLTPEERRVLLEPEAYAAADLATFQSLAERHLLRRADPPPEAFCRLLATYVRRQRIALRPEERGVRIDVQTGHVWVDGRQLPPLTDLEYRLLLLLYGHLDQIVDKYAVVEAVWGQSYIDEVDDARIEKLVSRLRQKIEGDPTQPRYLLTVRGRGYRLVSP
ncbi:MAG: winged helix-turn-helix domain-containing protein [Anaerolineae bacterium]|nr:winged helix-turn-helix domain-containing protein [Anaerolineae bacterium]